MRHLMIPLAALALLTACGGAAPTPEEEALPDTGEAPEMTANSAAAGVNANGSADAQPQTPSGPVSDQGSGAGDTTSTE